ncbi:alkyl hydroperoxide reductase [Candidatus Pacearchaeota archaeon CG10_big_fil_rev_8_21_14_0_10_30_48]|nr:MAG: alkyl hydroperoxide reductase [Candidatus Pacearchaeota archaeon CG10_big_fil_rev_8_21_14_0_10_30_48]
MMMSMAKLLKGQLANEFEAEDIEGKAISLKKYRGRKVMVSFFRYVACPLCNLRMHELITHYKKLHKKGLHIIALFQSPKEKILKYVGKQKLPFPIVPDPEKEIYKLYGVEESLFKSLKTIGKIEKFKEAKNLGFKGGESDGSKITVPADFLIDEKGIIKKVYYGRDISDHLPIEEIEEFLGD